jgi:hypothetical protein
MARVFRLVSVLIALGVLAEFFLAAAGAFGAIGYNDHRGLGVALLIAGAVALAIAIAGHINVRLPAALVALLALQFLFGHLGVHHHWIGAIHGLGALAVAAVTAINVRRAVGHA